jgi:uncharacterized protein (TIGR03437 family)
VVGDFAPSPGVVVVTHAASHTLAQLPETGLAPGSLFEIGVSFLNAAEFRFRAPGAAAPVELPVRKSEYAGRFIAVVPPGTPPGEVEVAVSDVAGKTYITCFWIAPSNFGLFADGAQVWRNGPERPRLTEPVRPGEWVTLWGTGLGNASTLTVYVAGVSVTPSFAGPAPGQPGLDQVNFRFPAGVPEDCYIPVTATTSGRTSNMAVLPAGAAPGPCRHRLGLSHEELAALDNGGQIPVSQIWAQGDVVFRPDDPSARAASIA